MDAWCALYVKKALCRAAPSSTTWRGGTPFQGGGVARAICDV